MSRVLELPLPKSDPGERRPDGVVVVGNATTLLHVGGLTVLTDPTFVHRHDSVDLGHGLSTRRLLDPAMDIDELPPIDLVLLSHLHGDHFDQVAQARLDHDLPVVTTPESASALHELGFHAALGLDTWDAVVVTRGDSRVRITSTPGRHGPPGAGLVLPDVMGSVLEWRTAQQQRRLYVTGDTLAIDDLREVPLRHPDIDVALFHLGGTRVLGVLVTMDADQGVEAMRMVDPRQVVPVHHEDYDVFTSSLDDFLEAATAAGLRDRVVVVDRGREHLIGPGGGSVAGGGSPGRGRGSTPRQAGEPRPSGGAR